MIKWLIYLPLNLICMLVCYITNPIAVLFCDEVGELHGIWKMWQTWDDSLDSYFYMHDVVPNWLDYDYDKHYSHAIYYEPIYGRERDISMSNGAEWTLKEKLQRYCCRVLWLYRNNAYGFMYYWLGTDPSGIEWKVAEDDLRYGVGKDCFTYKNSQRITDKLRWKIYIGWKANPDTKTTRAMYAYRIFIAKV